MHDYQSAFLKLALQHEVLRFGSFTLKSGRVSPYFFNLGNISSGAALRELGRGYAAAIEQAGIEFDCLFGPAYKGIPLAAAVSIALAERGRDVPFAYNRKEAKDHGEGGTLVGARLKGRVLVIDDVLTAGTALREALGMIRAAGAQPVAAVIALDRQEVGAAGTGLSAVAQLQQDANIRVVSLVSVAEILEYLSDTAAQTAVAEDIRSYQARYGSTG